MNKVYKDINEFFMENFPVAYLAMKEDEETSIQHYIDSSSEQLNKKIKEIMSESQQTSHQNKHV
jgi:hypothetical protein